MIDTARPAQSARASVEVFSETSEPHWSSCRALPLDVLGQRGADLAWRLRGRTPASWLYRGMGAARWILDQIAPDGAVGETSSTTTRRLDRAAARLTGHGAAGQPRPQSISDQLGAQSTRGARGRPRAAQHAIRAVSVQYVILADRGSDTESERRSRVGHNPPKNQARSRAPGQREPRHPQCARAIISLAPPGRRQLGDALEKLLHPPTSPMANKKYGHRGTDWISVNFQRQLDRGAHRLAR